MAKKLVKEVMDFVNRCSSIIGNHAHEDFSQESWSQCVELGTESPIEHILYTAFQTLARVNRFEKSEPFTNKFGQEVVTGLGIFPQIKIGDYRVDFVGEYAVYIGDGKIKKTSVIIECDSQQFHERSEQERRYEKKRDRYLLTHDYKVFHFTGTEIMREPFRVASEIISYLTAESESDLMGSLVNYE